MSRFFELTAQIQGADTLLPDSMPDSLIAVRSESRAETPRSGEVQDGYPEAMALVQRVFSGAPEPGPKVVVFTSAQRGAGCSWVCAKASEALAARRNGTVCIVDANLHSPAMHQYFGVDNRSGLAQALLDTVPIVDFVQEVPGRNLWVLPSGIGTPQRSGLLSSDRLTAIISGLRRAFTYVLIDCPAANAYADFTALSPVADGVILVLESASTRREAALSAKEALVAAKFRLLGAVLNKRTFPIPEFIYHRL